LKPERWGSPLVQEKYQEENACDKKQQQQQQQQQQQHFVFEFLSILHGHSWSLL
jgi:hypothetical protein